MGLGGGVPKSQSGVSLYEAQHGGSLGSAETSRTS